MEDILNSILSKLDDNSLQAISQKANASPDKAKSAMAAAIPVLMNALARNSSSPEGAQSLQNAIKRDHDGSLLDNLGGFLNNPEASNGAGILKHVLGGKRQTVEQYISKDSGLGGNSVGKILEMAAPLVMGYLGKKSGGGDENALGNVINSYLNSEKKQAPKSQSVINQLLDQNNDGSVIDDIARMGMSFLKRRRK
jgi:hypothetical protein